MPTSCPEPGWHPTTPSPWDFCGGRIVYALSGEKLRLTSIGKSADG
jgi:hypothetical protein